MFSGTITDVLFSFYSGTSSIPFQIFAKSTEWASGTFAGIDETATGSYISPILGLAANIKLNGHYWEMIYSGISGSSVTGSVANILAIPILSGGSTSDATCWDTYVPGENASIGYVGQSLKKVTHLIATYLATGDPILAGIQVDMSFDHVFTATFISPD